MVEYDYYNIVSNFAMGLGYDGFPYFSNIIVKLKIICFRLLLS